MNNLIRHSSFLFLLSIIGATGGCATVGSSLSDRAWNAVPYAIAYSLAPGATPISDVNAVNQAGNTMFSSAEFKGSGTGINSVGRSQFPQWVRVTWREYDPNRRDWTKGKIEGDYTVQVRDRIPNDVLAYLSAAKGRVLMLRFRVKNDGVLLSWDVEEKSARGEEYVFTMHGGDFKDPTIYNGKVIDPGWQK